MRGVADTKKHSPHRTSTGPTQFPYLWPHPSFLQYLEIIKNCTTFEQNTLVFNIHSTKRILPDIVCDGTLNIPVRCGRRCSSPKWRTVYKLLLVLCRLQELRLKRLLSALRTFPEYYENKNHLLVTHYHLNYLTVEFQFKWNIKK